MFQPNNPFLSDPDSAEKGKQLFRHGLLSEAVLAFEAEVGFGSLILSKTLAWLLMQTRLIFVLI